jgi:hypothetical protein
MYASMKTRLFIAALAAALCWGLAVWAMGA